mmetsp:Transcript_70815/g.124997  ORF Transcript_70815/g.124997 Transcript_70815/m.124997 type:complete len:448 (+) Transcript_70815:64-1407(+)
MLKEKELSLLSPSFNEKSPTKASASENSDESQTWEDDEGNAALDQTQPQALRKPLTPQVFRAKVKKQTKSAVHEYMRSRSVMILTQEAAAEKRKSQRKSAQTEQERIQRDILRSVQDSVMSRPLLMDSSGSDFHETRSLRTRSASAGHIRKEPETFMETKVERAISMPFYQSSKWAKKVSKIKERMDERPKLHEVKYPPKEVPEPSDCDVLTPRPTWLDQKIHRAILKDSYQNSQWAQHVDELNTKMANREKLSEISYPPKSYGEPQGFAAEPHPLPSPSASLNDGSIPQSSPYYKELSSIMERVNEREKITEMTYPPRERVVLSEPKNALLQKIEASIMQKAEERRIEMGRQEHDQRAKLKDLIEKGRGTSNVYAQPSPQASTAEPKANVLLKQIEAQLAEKVKARRAEMQTAERAQRQKLKEICAAGYAKSELYAMRKARPASAF